MQLVSDHGPLASEMAQPEAIRQQHDTVGAGDIFFGAEETAGIRLHAADREEIGGDRRGADLLGLAVAGEDGIVTVGRGHILKCRNSGFPVAEISG